MSTLSYFAKLTLAPGAVQPINAEGRNFWVVFSPVTIQIKSSGGEFGAYEQGTGLDDMPENATFKRLEVRNPSLGTITIVIYVGGPLYRDSRLNVIEGRTRIAPWPNASLAGATAVAFDGVTPIDGGEAGYTDLKRHSLIVANLDPASSLLIRNAAHVAGGAILPQTEQILPVSEAVEVYNPTGAAIACYIAEIWNTARLG